jgi:hypothetical protein
MFIRSDIKDRKTVLRPEVFLQTVQFNGTTSTPYDGMAQFYKARRQRFPEAA